MSASSTPFSKIGVWPSQDRSVVDSPSPPPSRRRRRGSATTAARHISLRSSARPTVIGLPERLSRTVAPASAASELGGIGTHTSSQTSACTTRPGTSSAAKSSLGRTERRRRRRRMCPRSSTPARPGGARRTRGRSAGRTSARPEHAAAMDDDGAVVDPASAAQGRADDEHRQQLGGTRDYGRDGRLDTVEHGVLEEQVLDRVAAQDELGEHRDRDALIGASPGLAQDRFRVRGRVGDRQCRARGDSRESVLVDGAEVERKVESYPIGGAAAAAGRQP